MALFLIVGGVGVGLAFLIADFAERIRHRVYEQRNREAPESQFKRYIAVGFAVLFVGWSAVAYL
jgi:hypothetical protein